MNLRPWALLAALTLACSPSMDRRGWECVAPANPGGGWDLACRTAGRALTDLGVAPGPVRTTNMPGAGGGIGFAHAVARREGDPTVFFSASPATTLRLAQSQFGPLSETDVRWIAAIAAEYGVLAVAADAPWQSLDDLLATLREDPSSVVVSGGSAVAGQDHMKVLLLVRAAGIDPRRIRYVPFDGGGEAMTALLGGFVHLFSGEASEIEGQVQAGRLRALTVLAPDRLEGPLANVPTAHESGIDVDWVTWRGFYVPEGLGQDGYDAWVAVFDRLGQSAEWEEVRRINRLEPFFLVGEEFEAFVHEQVESFRDMSREIGLIR